MRFQNITPENVCACIPARYASSRLHGKLLFDIGGQTVLERTTRRVLQCKWISKVIILADHEYVADSMKKLQFNGRVEVILNKIVTRNGTERIGKNLQYIPHQYQVIINIQGDEPFVDPENVDFVIEKHIQAHKGDPSASNNIFFSTLHQQVTDLEYMQETSCVKIVINRKDNAMFFTRAILPWNKCARVNKHTRYFACTGIYVFNRERVDQYCNLDDTPMQLEEDVEQLKVLEHGFVIKTFECPHFNEISVNTEYDYLRLLTKYGYSDSTSSASE